MNKNDQSSILEGMKTSQPEHLHEDELDYRARGRPQKVRLSTPVSFILASELLIYVETMLLIISYEFAHKISGSRYDDVVWHGSRRK